MNNFLVGYRGVLYKDTPALLVHSGAYHSRINVKGTELLVDNDELKSLSEDYLLVPFYKNTQVKITKEKKFNLIIETPDNILEVSKKDINFIFCRINKDNIKHYIEDFGICLLRGTNEPNN